MAQKQETRFSAKQVFKIHMAKMQIMAFKSDQETFVLEKFYLLDKPYLQAG